MLFVTSCLEAVGCSFFSVHFSRRSHLSMQHTSRKSSVVASFHKTLFLGALTFEILSTV